MRDDISALPALRRPPPRSDRRASPWPARDDDVADLADFRAEHEATRSSGATRTRRAGAYRSAGLGSDGDALVPASPPARDVLVVAAGAPRSRSRAATRWPAAAAADHRAASTSTSRCCAARSTATSIRTCIRPDQARRLRRHRARPARRPVDPADDRHRASTTPTLPDAGIGPFPDGLCGAAAVERCAHHLRRLGARARRAASSRDHRAEDGALARPRAPACCIARVERARRLTQRVATAHRRQRAERPRRWPP